MKKVLIVLVALTVIVLGYGGWIFISWLNGEKAEESNHEGTQEELSGLVDQRELLQGNVSEEDLAVFQEQNLNPFGHSVVESELTDAIYQEYIHGMSHQKVKASEKWGFYGIHPDRIEWLLNGLEEVELRHEELYRRILEKWYQGNFATAADDHNAIWELQGGSIGKATGVLSPEEEQAYIDSQTN
ncbi:DUF6241 domain-containing protein [Ornithinibacillus xuwenensis]|uniref:DUF6241 domain-containing protein n=1 Tax=Ornithinibacillus xuwenensis TaxID=3144668 RepID=A0ABU9XHW4_9BACI